MSFEHDVIVMGGCGHVGLPLGMAFADRGLDVVLYDVDTEMVAHVNSGLMPFAEDGADELLPQLLSSGRLCATDDPASLASGENIVVVVGTPVDRYLNPDIEAVHRALRPIAHHFRDGQLLVLRSTVYPGVTELVERLINSAGTNVDVAFCPERIAQGHALNELSALPQIVAARGDCAMKRATALFRRLTDDIVQLTPEEAELAKLFTNTWRYLKFAISNQFFMIANEAGVDFERIRHAITYRYPRAADMPGPGFTAGPCLFKDTMQLAAVFENNFSLGFAGVMINEGLPLYVISRLERRYDLASMTIGILGMAFKGGSDDTRSSLSYKLRRLLALKSKRVLCCDPHVTTDQSLVPLADVLDGADIIIIATPHPEFAEINTDVPVVDLFNLLGEGVRV